MSNKLKCFVAMSFSHEETILLFRNSLKPTLRMADITPRCLTGIEHNDDLNNKIISELNSADFVIADLTFARPSVYYEAGFAERVIPVIYTCRADHLKPGVDDPRGIQKVHFDLQMKNIITWRTVDDPIFKKRLLRRINFITKPLKRNVEAKLNEEKDKVAFSVLPTKTKLENLVTSSWETLRSVGMKKVKQLQGENSPILAFKRVRNEFTIVALYIGFKLNKSSLNNILRNYYRLRLKIYNAIGLPSKVKSNRILNEKLIFCSIEKFTFARLRDEFPTSYLGELPNSLIYNEEEALSGINDDNSPKFNLLRKFEAHLIDQIPYISNYKKVLLHRLNIDNTRKTRH